mgnify:FL=1
MPSLCRAHVLDECHLLFVVVLIAVQAAGCNGTLYQTLFPFMAHNSHNHDVINPRLCNDHCLVAISLHDIAFYIFGAVDNYPL